MTIVPSLQGGTKSFCFEAEIPYLFVFLAHYYKRNCTKPNRSTSFPSPPCVSPSLTYSLTLSLLFKLCRPPDFLVLSLPREGDFQILMHCYWYYRTKSPTQSQVQGRDDAAKIQTLEFLYTVTLLF